MELPEDEKDEFIQTKYYQLFNMNMKEVNLTRIEGKNVMFVHGDFINALENYLLRAYISIERIDFKKTVS